MTNGTNGPHGNGLDTIPDPPREKMATQWVKGKLGSIPDGVITVGPTHAGWYAFGRFASSGREVSYGPFLEVEKLRTTLLGAGWLPRPHAADWDVGP